MASVSNDRGGLKRVQFIGADGHRRAIRLGKATKRQADAFKIKVEMLVSGSITGVLDDEVARWVSELDDTIHGRLAVAGLVKPRARSAATLKGFLDEYFASLSVKPGTATAYSHTRECLLAFFGDTKAIRDIGPGDAE